MAMELHDRPVIPSPAPEELPEAPRCRVSEPAPHDVNDPVVEEYKKDVDQTLSIDNLKITPDQRTRKYRSFMNLLFEVRRAGEHLRSSKPERWCLRGKFNWRESWKYSRAVAC